MKNGDEGSRHEPVLFLVCVCVVIVVVALLVMEMMETGKKHSERKGHPHGGYRVRDR